MSDLFGPVLDTLLACAVGACATVLPDPPARVFTATGEIALDDCCGGQVWARLVTVTPSGASVVGPAAAQPCGVLLWEATVAVGVVRCALTVDDQGNPPDADAVSAETSLTTADMTALLDAIQCCAAPQFGPRRTKILRWDPVGPEGGCVGGEWTVTVLVDNCAC